MDAGSFLDTTSAAIVIGGTLLATFLRSGVGDCGLALAAIGQLGKPRFDADGTRAELAGQLREIRREGLLRVQPRRSGDREFDDVTDALIGSRSVAALIEAHESHKAIREDTDERAVRTLAQAAELAPVFGLAGTLASLTQLPADGIDQAAYMAAISMAVLSTLYGLLLANFIFAPLARLVERAAAHEERQRQAIIDWLARQLAATPATRRKPVLVNDEALSA